MQHDPRDQLRDFIHERLSYVRSHTACALMFVDMSDDVGAAYSVRAMAAHVRALVQVTNDLTKMRRDAEKADTDAAAAVDRDYGGSSGPAAQGQGLDPERDGLADGDREASA